MRFLSVTLVAVIFLLGCGSTERRQDPDGATIEGQVFYHRDIFFGPRNRQTTRQGWFDDNPTYVIVEGTEVRGIVRDDSSGDFGTYRLTDVPVGTAWGITAVREGYVKETFDIQLERNQTHFFDLDLYPNITVLITEIGAEPDVLSIPQGAVVTWVNLDDRNRSHRVSSSQRPFTFDSGNLRAHETYSFPFDEVGDLEYRISDVEDTTASIEVF